jgi:hypothetical protein
MDEYAREWIVFFNREKRKKRERGDANARMHAKTD